MTNGVLVLPVPATKASLTGKLEMGNNKFGRTTMVNPLVVAAFRDVSPESLKSERDVAKVYGKLFAGLEPKAKEFIGVDVSMHAGTESIGDVKL